MQCRPFAQGYLRNKAKRNSDENDEWDIYNTIAIALRVGIRYSELGNMSLIELSNILDAYFEERKHKPTQAEIDLIT